MVEMWAITPMFGILTGAILLSTVLAATFWAPKSVRVGERYTCSLVVGLRGAGCAVLACFGVLFWDVVVKVGFLGILGFANFSYFLAPLLLLGLTGALFLVAAGFTAPTRASLVSLATVVAYTIYFMQVTVLTYVADDSEKVFYEPALVCIAIVALIEGTALLYRAARRRRPLAEGQRLWDISAQFKKIANRKTIVIIWLLFVAEVWLEFEGLSLLFWLF